MAFVLVLLFGASLVAASAFKPAPAPRYRSLSPADVPCAIAGFSTCSDVPIDSVTRSILSTGDIFERRYGEGGGAIDFICIGGQDRDSMHDPRLCLSGGGKSFSDDHTERLPGTVVDARVYRVNSAIDSSSLDVMYFYYDDGRLCNEYSDVRRSMLWSDLVGRRQAPIFFFRFIRVVDLDQAANDSGHARMQQLAAAIWEAVRPTVSSLSQNDE
jgi:hypothetical protein